MSSSFLRRAITASLVSFALAFPFLAAGCTPRCSHAPDPLPTSGCVKPPSGFDRFSEKSFHANRRLTVVETMVSVDSEGCFVGVPVGGYAEPGPGETADFAVLRDEATGETWRIGSMVEGAFDRLRAGDAVHLSVDFDAYSFGGATSQLFLVREDGSLVHWCADSYGVDGLAVPAGFSIHTGDPQCRGKDSCGRWTEYGLVFAHGGKSVSADYGHVATVDGYRVLTGGVMANEGGLRHCSDGGGGSASAAIAAIDPSTSP
ncbi:MAG: hypothetical protein U0230_17725 [Polyangiales bacterium]